jgi:hypothetical protein
MEVEIGKREFGRMNTYNMTPQIPVFAVVVGSVKSPSHPNHV